MTTRQDMINAGREAVRLGVKYIYGAKPVNREFVKYSYNQIRSLQQQYGSDMVWPSDLAKAGSYCCDCSGLISKATGTIRGSYQLRSDAVERGTILQLKSNWAKYVGWGLWLPGHVGIVSDVEGYYYAMDGSARNAVHLPLAYQPWQEVLKISNVDYDVKPAPTPAKVYGYSTKLYRTNNTVMQQFRRIREGTHYRFVSIGRNMSLDVKDGSGKDHTPVRVWETNSGIAQLWDLKEIVLPSGVRCYEFIPVCAPNMRLDCVNGGTALKTGLQLHPSNSTDAQRWYLIEDSKAVVRIASAKSGLVIDCGVGVQ